MLLVAPHADDEVLGCGGTVRRLVDAGARLSVVVFARGDGGVDGTASVDRREAECALSCEILGAQPPLFLRIPSQQLRSDPAAAGAALGGAAAAGCADLLLVPSPLERHPTHAAALLAALLAPVAAFDAEVWGYGVWDALPLADGVAEIDISAVRKAKTRAMAAHRSQMDGRAMIVGIAGRDMAQACFSRLTGEESRKAVERLLRLADLAPLPAGADVGEARMRVAAWLQEWCRQWIDGLWCEEAPR